MRTSPRPFGSGWPQIYVYHYVAASHFRMKIANFLGTLYVGLDPIQIAAKMNYLGKVAYKEMMSAAGVSAEFSVMFTP